MPNTYMFKSFLTIRPSVYNLQACSVAYMAKVPQSCISSWGCHDTCVVVRGGGDEIP